MLSKIPIAPAYGGNRQRIRTFAAELQSCHDVAFALIPSRQSRDIDIEAHKAFFGGDRFVQLRRSKLGELVFNANILRRKILTKFLTTIASDNVDYLFDKSLEGACREVIESVDPDIVIVEYVHFSKILEWVPAGAYKLIDTHDSFSREFTPSAQRRGLSRADAVIAIQDREATEFRTLLASDAATKVITVSHIVADQVEVSTERCAGASFIGSYFEANNESLRALVDRVMPLVLAKRPSFKLHVIGDVGRAVPDCPFIIKRGRVPVVAEALAEAPVLANYIVKGTGIKIKLLDAMRMGVPCVSTELGAEGLTAEFIDGVTVAGDDQRFADELILLFDDAERRAIQSSAALRASSRWNERQRQALHAVIKTDGTSLEQDPDDHLLTARAA
ncbi:glycosyltransferase [Sphingomonas sp. CV7422]|uniref:glycosyltransferase n=1 Tax=Sphingomonas sp. CV7422 TaxID=3018036 RepID=UPI0022FDBD53|nr:glycosyltransferase [Sphingomonas sp. CV7422]